MATASDIITYARILAQTDSNGISDVAGLAYTNDSQQDFIRELIAHKIDAAQTQESYTATTTNNPNTYAWPSNMYMLKTIEVDFTGSGGQNYLQATALDVANIQNASFDWLRLNQSSASPLFDNRGDTFEIFPIPPTASGSGLRIFYYLKPTEYASTATTLTYPVTLDYRALSAKVAYLYALTLEKGGITSGGLAADMESEYQKRLKKIIEILAPASQQPTQPTPLSMTGWNY